ncbi:hypothetical protein [Croceitalea rosinachiae]|uniref:Uncharacterized protein n=1 Tax=Croceitalea rosinachiae TaxID=3075596 RepID=A0ABU3A6T8_9FLAO|nr:hypothetical protein [Croceitalea sp. F388]MDT0605892.1 hypothetical protein [Croceitalea sp. F388]
MGIGNPKRFEKRSRLKNILPQGKSETGEGVTKVYKDKNHEVKKALKFKTTTDKAKLA